MSADQHRRASELFGEIVDLDPKARAAFLAKSCDADDDLAREVLALLKAHDESDADSFLGTPPSERGSQRSEGTCAAMR